jgi:hypothetical protein
MTEDEEDVEIDRIYHDVDALLSAGRFYDVVSMLDAVDVEKWPTVVILAYCTITWPARDRLLHHRDRYVARVRKRLTVTEPGRVDELLYGLESKS